MNPIFIFRGMWMDKTSGIGFKKIVPRCTNLMVIALREQCGVVWCIIFHRYWPVLRENEKRRTVRVNTKNSGASLITLWLPNCAVHICDTCGSEKVFFPFSQNFHEYAAEFFFLFLDSVICFDHHSLRTWWPPAIYFCKICESLVFSIRVFQRLMTRVLGTRKYPGRHV